MSDSEMGYVYTLNDPRTNEPKYVGATKDPQNRFYMHNHGATNGDVQEWLDGLEKEGLEPEMLVIQVTKLDELPQKELDVIKRLSDEWELLNRRMDGSYSSRGGSNRGETKNIKVPDPVYEKAHELKEMDGLPTLGEAVRLMCREGGYDV